jgi:hypothetical protein
MKFDMNIGGDSVQYRLEIDNTVRDGTVKLRDSREERGDIFVPSMVDGILERKQTSAFRSLRVPVPGPAARMTSSALEHQDGEDW